MGVIEVNGIRVFGYHGCLPEEARIGGRYQVDVRVSGDFGAAERSDKVGSSRVDLQACKLEYSIVSPK